MGPRSEVMTPTGHSGPSFQALHDCLILVERLYRRFELSGSPYPIDLPRLDLRISHLLCHSPDCDLSLRRILHDRCLSLRRQLSPSPESTSASTS